MNELELKNWKLKEIEKDFEVYYQDSFEGKSRLLEKTALPLSDNLTGISKSETEIDWEHVSNYNKFNFDLVDNEVLIKQRFENSKLKESSFIIITYGFKEPIIKISTKLFIDDWEGFVRSTKYESIITSEDYTLVMEVTRDFIIHSNFII